jgi:nucleoside 2-deoxyribosyltransferase
MRIYLAGPLFTQAEQEWLRRLKAQILTRAAAAPVEVCWPHDLFSAQEIADWGDRAKHEIFARCRDQLDRADAVVALLDGTQVDDGTAWEIGYFSAGRRPGKPIIGIRTDFRKAGDADNARVNLMIDCSCDSIVTTVDELLREIGKLSTNSGR